MSCQPGPVVMLRSRGHRQACGQAARLIRSVAQAGLEEAAWKRQEPAARGRLIALQEKRHSPRPEPRLIARRLSIVRTLSEPTAWKRQEPAARETLIVLRRERDSPATNQPLIERGVAGANSVRSNGAKAVRIDRARAMQANVGRAAARNLAVNQKRNLTFARNVALNGDRNVRILNYWRNDRFRGGDYVAFYNYNRVWHDRSWWVSYYPHITFVLGGWWYWNAGYWYPAWGYDPYGWYSYDGPIYTGYAETTPDRMIEDVQLALQQQGYYAGAIDGRLGPQTRGALAAFQSDNGLAITSAVDRPTLQTLGLS